MMVLTRRSGEEIVIEGPAKITVLSFGPGRVRLGITAKPGVRVDRGEIARLRAREAAKDPEGDGCGPLTEDDRDSLERIREEQRLADDGNPNTGDGDADDDGPLHAGRGPDHHEGEHPARE